MKYLATVSLLLYYALPLPAQNCDQKFVNLQPLTDMGKSLYKGFEGGLYPGGLNNRPIAHQDAGVAIARSIVPLNSIGQPEPNGRIVLLSIGMSNATQEFSVFKTMADTMLAKNPRLSIVDGAQGGQTAAVIVDSTANFWRVIDQRLANHNLTREQVQIAWVKEANANPTQAFPVHAQTLSDQLVLIAQILKNKYPNIRLAYYSSRTYGGYATTTLNPEPYAYETGYAVKWAIERQINGSPDLSFSGPNANAPWLAWGPYLWADGERGRSDSMKWFCTEFSSDGTHPSATGRQKVAGMLLDFFSNDETTRDWFIGRATSVVLPERVESMLGQNHPNPFSERTLIPLQSSESQKTLLVRDLLGRIITSSIIPQGIRYMELSMPSSLPMGMYFYHIEGLPGMKSMLYLGDK